MKSRLISQGDEQYLSERLSTHVDRLAGLIGPRHLGKPNSIEVTATHIVRAFGEYGYSRVRRALNARLGCCPLTVVCLDRELADPQATPP